MKNQPYVKKYAKEADENGVYKLLNPITKDNPYNHVTSNQRVQKRRFKYLILTNPLTGAFVGEVKLGGNNRKCNKRTGKKRTVFAM